MLFDRLPARDRRRLAALARAPDHYGVLRPRPGSGLGLQAVDRETALLVLTLARPGPLPGYVTARLGEAAARSALARLVADGVLEIEGDAGDTDDSSDARDARDAGDARDARGASDARDAGAAGAGGDGGAAGGPGRFVSGAAAMGLLVGAPTAVEGAAGAAGMLAELSHAALRHGEELARTLPGIEARELSLRLYGYNRRPLTPAWRRALPSPAAVRGYLGVAPGGACHGLAARFWHEEPPAAGAVWLHWRSRSPAMPAGLSSFSGGAGPAATGRPTYKLYVGVPAEALPEAFGAILDGLAAAGAPGFKVGAGAAGLLRPDKLVAYFPAFEGLAAAAAALGERLEGLAPQGVPFSAAVGSGGLLSWGVDPPGLGGGGWDPQRTSWRLWLTDRLARALLAAVRAEAALAPWRFAVERVRLEGVDPATWVPAGGLWQSLDEGV